MRLEVRATERELAEKAPEILAKLESLFRSAAPETAELLRKAIPDKPVTLRYPVLHDLQKQTGAIYRDHIDRMLIAIGKVMDRSL
jgi:hypothetical protein